MPPLRASSEDLAVAGNSVPAVGLSGMLEHIDDAAAALRSFHAALAPQVRLYIIVPAHNRLWSL